MKKLFEQIFKFAIVGGISFVVDFLVYTIMCNVLNIHYIIAGVSGFTVSVVVNYILSMRFVFVSKEDMRKDKEFIIFVVLSLIGMLLNSVILYICIDMIYMNWAWFNQLLPIDWMNILAKVIATGIVMVYNFVTRKIFLEKKEDDNECCYESK